MSMHIKVDSKLTDFSCIFYINDDVNLLREELDFGFKAWTNFHSSIVGFKPMVSELYKLSKINYYLGL